MRMSRKINKLRKLFEDREEVGRPLRTFVTTSRSPSFQPLRFRGEKLRSFGSRYVIMLEKEDRSLGPALGDGGLQFAFNPFEAVFINAVGLASVVGRKRYKLKSADLLPTVSGRLADFFP